MLRCQIGAGVKTFSGQIGSGVIEAQESESFVSQRVSRVRFVLESQSFKGQRRSGSESFGSHIGSGSEVFLSQRRAGVSDVRESERFRSQSRS